MLLDPKQLQTLVVNVVLVAIVLQWSVLVAEGHEVSKDDSDSGAEFNRAFHWRVQLTGFGEGVKSLSLALRLTMTSSCSSEPDSAPSVSASHGVHVSAVSPNSSTDTADSQLHLGIHVGQFLDFDLSLSPVMEYK